MVLRVLHLTDSHLYAEPHARQRGLDTESSLAAVIEQARRESWDLALVTGDLVHDGSAAGYRRLAGHLETLGVPVLCIPGNHDEPAVMGEALTTARVQWQRSFTAPPWTLLLLDSHLPGAVGGELGEAELAFLESSLAAGDGPVLVALHHAPVAVGSPWIDGDGLHDAAALWAVIDRQPRVRGVVWGHIHQDYEARRAGIRLMATPSTGIQFLPGSAEFTIDPRPPGYRRLLLHADGAIDSAVVRVQSGGQPL